MKHFPLPFKEEKLLRMSRIFRPLAGRISHFFPSLKSQLREINYEFSNVEYISMSLFSGFYFFTLFFAVMLFLGTIATGFFEALPRAVLFSILLGGIMFISPILGVRAKVTRRMKLLEKDLLFALKYLYVKVKSGVPLYDAMVGVAYGKFGEISGEFKKTIMDINSGVDQVVALESMALRNPSSYFRRTIWQITNNMRAGADIAKTLESITQSLVKEHKILIKKYGSELNPVILMYMMFTVIIPSLGITVVVVMSSFSGIDIPRIVFYLIPAALVGLQFFFISLIKTKRPLLSM